MRHRHKWFREAMAEPHGGTSWSRTATCLVCFAEKRGWGRYRADRDARDWLVSAHRRGDDAA